MRGILPAGRGRPAAAGVAGGLLFVCWLLAACNQPLSQTEADGKDLYEVHCFECHDENQLELKKPPPRLHNLFAQAALPDGVTPATDDAVRQVILHGKRTMPAFNGRLDDQQIADLLAYLHRK